MILSDQIFYFQKLKEILLKGLKKICLLPQYKNGLGINPTPEEILYSTTRNEVADRIKDIYHLKELPQLLTENRSLSEEIIYESFLAESEDQKLWDILNYYLNKN